MTVSHVSSTFPSPTVAFKPVGAAGVTSGTSAFAGVAAASAECTLSLSAVAVTVNVYLVPFVSPVTVKFVSVSPVFIAFLS